MCACVCAHATACVLEDSFVELDLFLSFFPWVLGIELRLSGFSVGTFIHCAILAAPKPENENVHPGLLPSMVMMVHTWNPSTWNLRQEHRHEFSLGRADEGNL